MKDILSEIVAHKRVELEALEAELPLEELRAMALAAPASTRSLRKALASSESGIIAEFKRKSPSKGWIHRDADPLKVIPEYVASGAAALSILTDSEFFGGSLDYIKALRQSSAMPGLIGHPLPSIDLPILRKDFIISEYQLLEARLAGADAVLLIAACLNLEECTSLCAKAHGLGLEVLLEIHSENELIYASCAPDCLGVNNRNLGTFVTDVANSFRLSEKLTNLEAGSILGSSDALLCSETTLANGLAATEPDGTSVGEDHATLGTVRGGTMSEANGGAERSEASERPRVPSGDERAAGRSAKDDERTKVPPAAKKPVLVSESGISRPETVRELRAKGFRGFLMGENFMKEAEPGAALRNFIAEL